MKKYLYIFLSLLYLEIIFLLLSYGKLEIYQSINILLFTLINSCIVLFLMSLFNDKTNSIIKYSIYTFLGIWYSTYYLFNLIFKTPFSIVLIRQSDQIAGFAGNTFKVIISNLHIEVLFFIPLILIIIFRKKISELLIIKKDKIIIGVSLPLLIIFYFVSSLLQPRGVGSTYNLLYENDNTALNIKTFGVINTTFIDIYRLIFGFDEKLELVNDNNEKTPEPDIKEVIYEYNKQDIDFSGSDQISRYMANEEATFKNEYTGLFKGKNLIYIVAESFSEIAVSKEYTPTLYKMVNEGFNFKNFYTSNNLSTIGGEFQALTGLYADNSMLTKWRSGYNYFIYGLANVFRKEGYNTFAYHNHTGFFQDRYKYIRSQGFTNFKACNFGLQKLMNCSWWPNSDIDMMRVTLPEYINSDKPFMTYYMTVSGHMNYTRDGNRIVNKNWHLVKDLPYNNKVKGYIATQMELDKAVELLIKRLEEKQKLNDTVFVLVADHYPYGLSLTDINSISTYKRDEIIEANRNNLIIYNASTPSFEVEKVGMSIDVIPTIFNLFGINYDSRLIVGKDILSTTEGIAFFKDRSWVSNKGTYRARTREFIKKTDEEVSEDYINKINSIVSNRILISKNIVLNNYYNRFR